MLPTEAAFIDVVRRALARGIAPHLSGEPRKLADSGLQLALGELAHRQGGGEARLAQVYADLQALSARYNTLAASGPQSGASAVIAAALGDHDRTVARLSERIDVLRGDLVDGAVKLAAVQAAAPKAWQDQVRTLFADLTRNEMDEVTRAPLPGPAESDADRIAQGREKLEALMRTALGAPDLEITDHFRISGGFSRDTFILTTQAGGKQTRYVVRATALGGGYTDGLNRSIPEEFPLLKAARAHGVPAPESYILVEDPEILGASFILMAFCPGVILGDNMRATGQIPAEIYRQTAELLAQLHSLPWQDHPETFPALTGRGHVTAAEGAAMYLERCRTWREKACLRPSAAITLAEDWLARNIPQTDRPATFVHGNIGFHNMLIEDGRIQALLDWESGAVGDPAWDLITARLMLDGQVSWETFAGWYETAGGCLPPEADLAYWRMFRAYSGNLSCAIALEEMFERAASPEYLELGVKARPFYMNLLLENGQAVGFI